MPAVPVRRGLPETAISSLTLASNGPRTGWHRWPGCPGTDALDRAAFACPNRLTFGSACVHCNGTNLAIPLADHALASLNVFNRDSGSLRTCGVA